MTLQLDGMAAQRETAVCDVSTCVTSKPLVNPNQLSGYFPAMLLLTRPDHFDETSGQFVAVSTVMNLMSHSMIFSLVLPGGFSA